jgi:transposase
MYPKLVRAGLVEKLLAPGGPSAEALAKEVDIPARTLSHWRMQAATVGDMSKRSKPRRSGHPWNPAEKLRVVVAASQLSDEELGEFLRREGLHGTQLAEWRADVLAALGEQGAPRRWDPSAKTVRELERELARKDKALAEVTALLVLRKKLDALFGPAEEGSSPDEKNGKK